MRMTPRSLAGPVAVAAALLATSLPARADEVYSNGVLVIHPVARGEAPPLALTKPDETVGPIHLRPEHELPSDVNGRGKGSLAPLGITPAENVLQTAAPLAMPAFGTGFTGVGSGFIETGSAYTVSGAPPDTNMDVGPNHIIQWVNTAFAIFDKSGTPLYGWANGKTLWTSLGGRCATDNNGDPLVMYDQIADRWFMSQFAVSASPYHQCVAVSKTSDPVNGGWWLYDFQYGTNFNDYGKSGVWPDGYYIMYHMFSGSNWAGTQVCAFDRAKMLTGAAATQQCFGPNPSYGGLLPSNLKGSTLPPAGAPNYYMTYGSSGVLQLWKFHVDWTTPANSTFGTGGGFGSPTNITAAAFRQACGNSGGACVPQSGTTTQLDTLGDRAMWRLNYRNFGTYESLVLTHSVDTGSTGTNPTGVRWYEIRSPGTTPTVYQQGTFAPADGKHRWMPSIDMDQKGNIAIGYSASSGSMFPSINVAGRLVTDTLGQMAQGEAQMFAGSGSQTTYSSSNCAATGGGANANCPLQRWGDYSIMTVDPADGCTFWYTTEYLPANGTFNWRTRIGSFKFTPAQPTGLTATPGLNKVTLNWTAQSDASGYVVYRGNGACPGTGMTQLTPNPVTGTSYVDTTAVGGTTYSYQIYAVSCGTSVASACASTTATVCPASATVTGTATICSGASTQISAALTGTGPWNLTWSDGFPQNGVATSPATRSVSPTSSTTYTVTAVSDASCTGSASGSAAVTVTPKTAMPAISAPASVGAGSPNRIASVTLHAGSSYAWNIVNGTITSGQGTSQIAFTAGTTGTLGLSVVETASGSCASDAGTATVNVLDSWSSVLFYAATPCRVFDTRNAAGPLGGPAFAAGQTRSFQVANVCGIPATARALSVNLTMLNAQASGSLVMFRSDTASPSPASSISFRPGIVRANNGLVQISVDGNTAFSITNNSAGTVDVLMDVNGWFK